MQHESHLFVGKSICNGMVEGSFWVLSFAEILFSLQVKFHETFTFIEGLRHGCGRALTIDGDDVQYAIGIGKKFELIFDL